MRGCRISRPSWALRWAARCRGSPGRLLKVGRRSHEAVHRLTRDVLSNGEQRPERRVQPGVRAGRAARKPPFPPCAPPPDRQTPQVHWHLIPAPIFAHEQRIDTAKAEKTALKTAGSGRKSALASATAGSGSGGRCVNAGKPLGGAQGGQGGAAAAEPPTQSWLIRREGHRREFLEDDEADELVDKIRSRL